MVRAPACGAGGWQFESAHPPTPNMFYTYILQSAKNGRYYIGSTSNLGKRLAEHNRGKSLSTRANIPYKIIYFEEYENRSLAQKREYEIKSYKGGNAFKKLLNP